MREIERHVEIPDELLRGARECGWPDALLQRAVDLGVHHRALGWWISESLPINRVERAIDAYERVTFGPMRLREAMGDDDEKLTDLFANSPEEIGDWEVTVERGPNPFAQFRLQENPQIHVLEELGVLLAVNALSVRNAIVGGHRITVGLSSAARVRREDRGKGYSRYFRWQGPTWRPYHQADYYYIRSHNVAALRWLKATNRLRSDTSDARADDVPGLAVSVHCLPRRPFEGDPAGIREVRASDLRRCVALINQTHRGQDLWRPYTVEFLGRRLDDSSWGAKPDWWPRVYGWPDYHVLEQDGRIVACAGLWDRGKDVREVWRQRATGEINVRSSTAVLDFGYARGSEDAMERLVAYLLGETDRLGRDRLMIPVEQLPALRRRLERYEPVLDTRALVWMVYDPITDSALPSALTRPHTDLAYW